MLIFNNLAYTFEFRHGSCHISSVQLIMMFCIQRDHPIFFGWLSSSTSHSAPKPNLAKRRLAIPPSSASLLLPPIHATRWKQRLGIWLKQWVADHQQLFPSLFLPKIRVIETRSATLGDQLFNYRGWQQRWTPDTHFRCACFDVSSQHLLYAHSHAVILSHFDSVFSQIGSDIMAASMKDQYYGSTDKLLDQLRQKIRRLACRLRIRSSTFLTDIQVALQEIIDEHHSNLTSSSRWTSEAITLTASPLKNWVVTPADHFPSLAHVLCPALFSRLLHSTFCTGEVFVPCRQPAAAFRAHMLTTIPLRTSVNMPGDFGYKHHCPQREFYPSLARIG